MNKKRLLAYLLAINTLAGCGKIDKNITIETTQETTTQTIESNIPTEPTTDTNTPRKPLKQEIAKYAFANCYIEIYDEEGNLKTTIEPYEPLLVLDYYEEEKGNTEALLEDGTFININYMQIEVLPESYVEVDISKQKLYCYYNNELVLSADVVTGNPNIGTIKGTNKGYTEINGKAYNTTLMGNAKVEIFISFNSHGEGFHDAKWRSKFGDDIYINNGSHGCVNMKLEDVKILDNYVNVGTKVLIHK